MKHFPPLDLSQTNPHHRPNTKSFPIFAKSAKANYPTSLIAADLNRQKPRNQLVDPFRPRRERGVPRAIRSSLKEQHESTIETVLRLGPSFPGSTPNIHAHGFTSGVESRNFSKFRRQPPPGVPPRTFRAEGKPRQGFMLEGRRGASQDCRGGGWSLIGQPRGAFALSRPGFTR